MTNHMYCQDCEKVIEPIQAGDGFAECPNCGCSILLEALECQGCGMWFSYEDLTDKLCNDCQKEA